jgi:hypothetical protein
MIDMFGIFEIGKKRKSFSIRTKKIEWMKAGGHDSYDYITHRKFIRTSRCRNCGRRLAWGDGTYNFDHKDNNPANNSQRNCYLVCRNCHGKHTVVKKRKVKGFFGETIGHKTVKRKVGYKKPKKKPRKTRRVAIRGIFGEVIGYRTVKVRKPKAAKKKITRSRKKKTKRRRTTRRKKTSRKRRKTKRKRR